MVAGVVRAGVGVVDEDDPGPIDQGGAERDHRRKAQDRDGDGIEIVDAVGLELWPNVEPQAVQPDSHADIDDQGEVLQVTDGRRRHEWVPPKSDERCWIYSNTNIVCLSSIRKAPHCCGAVSTPHSMSDHTPGSWQQSAALGRRCTDQ